MLGMLGGGRMKEERVVVDETGRQGWVAALLKKYSAARKSSP
jgi:hypothetical protein